MRANSNTFKNIRILMVAANRTLAPTGMPVGFWGSELTHPYYAFTEAGYQIDIASPKGGEIVMDDLSDPRHPSGYSAEDLITMGFVNTPKLMALLQETKRLEDVDPTTYDAIVVCGGRAPGFAFRSNSTLKKLLATFYESGKITTLLCHGVAAVIDVQLSDDSYLITGKTITGFANVEEDVVDSLAGKPLMSWRIEDAARERGANFVQAGLWKPFAIRDGHLITGQQQYSGTMTAKLVIEVLGR